MNILFLYTSPITAPAMRGGIQRVTETLINYFEKKHNVFILTTTTKYSADKEFLATLNRKATYVKNQYFIPEDFGDVSSYPKANKDFFLNIVKDNKIDIIVNQGGLTPLLSEFSYLAKKKLEHKPKLFSVIHSTLLGNVENLSYVKELVLREKHLAFLIPIIRNPIIAKFILKLYAKKRKTHVLNLCKNSDKVILLSERFKPEISQILGYVPDNVIAINNPISLDFVTNNVGEKKKKIIWVGRINEGKRLDLFLSVWKKLFKEFPDWSVDILGKGHFEEYCRKIISDNKMRHVTFHGVKDSIDYFKEASIFCFTTTYEGFGITIVEAMAMKCVPMSFDSFKSVRDIIDDDVNGILIRPFDLNEYEEKLRNLMKNSSLREKMANSAYEKSKQFHVEKIGKKWMDIL